MARDPGARSDAEDTLALERFVIENDDLMQLEERIGRFNIFDALKIERRELQHSNFLAWLLNPAESHGQGDLFLRAVLIDMLKQAPVRPLSPLHLDGLELRGVEVVREHRNIDILIVCEQPALVVVIENKIDSSEHSNQLDRYETIVKEEHPSVERLLVYLTREGEPASEEGWTPYSYARLHHVLSRVRRIAAGSIGSDVDAFLQHYLGLIGSRFMHNKELADLCRKIYATHRRAIDLINEHADEGGQGVLRPVGDAIKKEPGGPWEFFNQTGRWLRFTPISWLEASPALGDGLSDERALIAYEIYADTANYIRVTTMVCPMTDAAKREKLIQRLTRDPEEFGFRLKGKKGPSPRWTRIFSDTPYKWKDEDTLDAEEAATKVIESFQAMRKRHGKVAQAIRESMQSQK
jgi:hypothetical protein